MIEKSISPLNPNLMPLFSVILLLYVLAGCATGVSSSDKILVSEASNLTTNKDRSPGTLIDIVLIDIDVDHAIDKAYRIAVARRSDLTVWPGRPITDKKLRLLCDQKTSLCYPVNLWLKVRRLVEEGRGQPTAQLLMLADAYGIVEEGLWLIYLRPELRIVGWIKVMP